MARMKWGPKFHTGVAYSKPFYDPRFNRDFDAADAVRKNPWARIRGIQAGTKYREKMKAKREVKEHNQEEVDARIEERIENVIVLLNTCLHELSVEAREQGGNKSRFNQAIIVTALLKLCQCRNPAFPWGGKI